jgi:hypothetical protein
VRTPAGDLTLFMLVATATLVAACASTPPPPPFRGPPIDLDITHFAGSPLSGPVDEGADEGALDAVAVTVLALERLPDDLLGAASLATDLIVAPADVNMLLPVGRLSRDARYGARAADREQFQARLASGDLGRTVTVGVARGAAGAGITSRFAITAREERLHPDRPVSVRPRLTLLLRGEGPSVATGPLRLAVVLDGLIAEEAESDEPIALAGDAGTEDEAPAAPRRRVVREESILLRSEPGDEGHCITVVIPTPFDPAGGAALAVLLDVTPTPGPDSPDAALHRDAIARCRREVVDAAARARTETSRGVPPSNVWPGLGATLGTADAPPPRRSLAFLARSTGAPFAEDLALAATDELVAAFGQSVFEALATAPEWPERDALAWILEREAYRRIAEELVSSGRAPALESLLVRHLGEVGRHPALMEELLLESDGVTRMAEHVVEENLILLEDSAPAARLRAFDWLTLKGRAPEGYHPLAPRKERQTALRKALDESASGEGDER